MIDQDLVCCIWMHTEKTSFYISIKHYHSSQFAIPYFHALSASLGVLGSRWVVSNFSNERDSMEKEGNNNI